MRNLFQGSLISIPDREPPDYKEVLMNSENAVTNFGVFTPNKIGSESL